MPPTDLITFHQRVRITLTYIVAFAVALALLVYASGVLFAFFASILGAIVLRDVAEFISKYTPIGTRFAIFMLAALVIGMAIWGIEDGTPAIITGMGDLADTASEGLDRLSSPLEGTPFEEQVLSEFQGGDGSGLISRLAENLESAAVTVVSGMFSLVLFFFVSVYLTLEPQFYRNILVRMLPADYRERAVLILEKTEIALGWWLVARFSSMLVIGVITFLGLWLLGVPQAPELGLIAGLLSFIPNLGPVLSVVPAILVASTEGVTLVVSVILLYVVLQAIESYIITPYIERRTVSLPPAAVILAQLLLTLLAGPIGALVAAPLIIVGMVGFKFIYLPVVLNETSESVEFNIGPEQSAF